MNNTEKDLQRILNEFHHAWEFESWPGFGYASYTMAHSNHLHHIIPKLARVEGIDNGIVELLKGPVTFLHDLTRLSEGIPKNGLVEKWPNGLYKGSHVLPVRTESGLVKSYLSMANIQESCFALLHSDSSGMLASKIILPDMGYSEEETEHAVYAIEGHILPYDGHVSSEMIRMRMIFTDCDKLDSWFGPHILYRRAIHNYLHSERNGFRSEAESFVNFAFVSYNDGASWVDNLSMQLSGLRTNTGINVASRRYRKLLDYKPFFQDELVNPAEGGLVDMVEFFMSNYEDPDLERDLNKARKIFYNNPIVVKFCTESLDEIYGRDV